MGSVSRKDSKRSYQFSGKKPDAFSVVIDEIRTPDKED
jgi:hypothetical protein